MTRMAVSAAVVSDDPAMITRAAEVLGRACAGLALEGAEVDVHIETEDDEDGQS